MRTLDFFLDRFRWYRRRRGGVWHRTWDLPFYQGGFEVWWHNRLPSVPHKLLVTEDYSAK